VPDLRTPDDGAPPLTRSSPVRAARTATALLCTIALAGGAAGCGGSEVDYQEVPGPPADVAIPSATVAPSGTASGDAGATPTPTPTAEPGSTTAPSDQTGGTGADPGASTDTGTNTSGTTDTGGSDSGGATAPADEDSATNDTAPPAGSDAQQFEDFCAQNPGAC
jgi:hypothetical protein